MRQTFLPVLLGLAIAVLPLAPVEHVHKAAGPDGHDHAFVHAHTRAHHSTMDGDGDHHVASLGDDDSVVLALDPVFAVPYSHVEFGHAVTLIRFVEEPPVTTANGSSFVEQLIHGPPRAPSALRGPPLTSLL